MSYSQGPFYSNVNDSGGGGGGFISPYGSQDSPRDGSKKSSQYSLRALTILSMHNAQQAHGEANFTVDGIEIGQVTVVAQVVEDVDPQSTNILFRIDDGTARIDARHWLEQHESASDFSHITEGSYIRVMGSLKQINNKRHLSAPHVRLASPKEFLFHKAEVMLVWAQTTLPVPGQPANISHVVTAGGDTSAYTSGGLAQQAENPNYAHLPALERRILECIQSAPARDEGVPVDLIAKRLDSNATLEANELTQALDRLMDEGHIYSTIDDSHFMIA
ncbi:hypothetical protein JB92DRAFT_2889745 [Gautieria morchelliformis]|nr:hypothetical protein JB92DRAFT_2889745 [Gautieria morchelliformis]